MAMNGDTLGTAIMAAVDALSDENKTNRTEIFKAIGNAIVTHIQNNAVASGLDSNSDTHSLTIT